MSGCPHAHVARLPNQHERNPVWIFHLPSSPVRTRAALPRMRPAPRSPRSSRGAGWSVCSHVVVPDDTREISLAIRAATDERGCRHRAHLRGYRPFAARCDARGDGGRVRARRAGHRRGDPRVFARQDEARHALARPVHAARGARRGRPAHGQARAGDQLPGSTKAARECWDAIADQLEHAMQMSRGGRALTRRGVGEPYYSRLSIILLQI